ncbi:hypothetical protein J4482_04730 [Candidatus Woesearchaeota archaeon]|nr:hypothetical protein [Candidatus Woesearchaeota archaeon]
MVDSRIKKLIEEKFPKDKVEMIEAARGSIKDSAMEETAYPKPLIRHFLVYESFGSSIEESYFWMKDMLHDLGYTEFEKIVDTFTASEQSAFFGSAQQRLGIQQDKAVQYLATIGKMTKELFQIVRDIKLLEEREDMYKLASAEDDGAEKALKGVWIDFIDNGPQGIKASSVYGLASQIGFTVLPDLFFAAPANIKQAEVSNYVKSLDFNEKVKTALVRKLEQYVAWRDATAKEITSKKKFTIQYLRQHYDAIKLYTDWVKPYLRNVKRLGMDPEKQLSADIVGAFEGSVVEIEVLAKKPGNPHACVLMTFYYRTRAIMQTGQDYQRGPAHVGRMEMTLRGYVWTDEEIKNYRELKMAEDFEMLKSIDTSIEQAMDYLGDKLVEYLKAAGEKFGEEDRQEELARFLHKNKKTSTMEEARSKAKKILGGEKKSDQGSIASIFKGFADLGKELGGGFIPSKNAAKEAKKEEERIKEEKEKLVGGVISSIGLAYDIYKKAHRFFVP